MITAIFVVAFIFVVIIAAAVIYFFLAIDRHQTNGCVCL